MGRPKKKIEARKAFAIVVDGETEVWYFQMLKRNERQLNVNIEPKIPQKKKIEDQFKTVEELASDYTTVFWAVDLDVLIKEDREAPKGQEKPSRLFDRLKKKADKIENVITIVNNPCLEYWFILHFEYTKRCFNNCAQAEQALKKYLTGYEKTQKFFTKQDDDIYLKLKAYLKTAVENAEKLDSFTIEDFKVAICDMDKFFQTAEMKTLIS